MAGMSKKKQERDIKFLENDMPRMKKKLQNEREDVTSVLEKCKAEMKIMMIPVSIKQPGDSFGELALLFDPNNPNKIVKRAATIKTIRDSVFAIINKADYRKVLAKIE